MTILSSVTFETKKLDISSRPSMLKHREALKKCTKYPLQKWQKKKLFYFFQTMCILVHRSYYLRIHEDLSDDLGRNMEFWAFFPIRAIEMRRSWILTLLQILPKNVEIFFNWTTKDGYFGVYGRPSPSLKSVNLNGCKIFNHKIFIANYSTPTP